MELIILLIIILVMNFVNQRLEARKYRYYFNKLIEINNREAVRLHEENRRLIQKIGR